MIAGLQLYDYLFWSVGTISIVYAFAPQRFVEWVWAKFGPTATIPTETNLTSTDKPSEAADNAALDEEVLHPEKRVYTHSSAAEIFAAVRDMTSIEIEGFVQPHIGKWIRVQSIIRDIYQDDASYSVLLGRVFEPMVHLSFANDEWPEIATMTQGKRLAAEGRIQRIERSALYMDYCELVELNDNDDIFRQP